MTNEWHAVAALILPLGRRGGRRLENIVAHVTRSVALDAELAELVVAA